jgi:hypothetical protein
VRSRLTAGFCVWIVALVGAVGVLVGQSLPHHHAVTPIPMQEVYVLCQPAPYETSANFAACAEAVSEAWEMAQR